MNSLQTPPPFQGEDYSAPQVQYDLMPGVVSKLFRKTFGWMAMCLLITALTAFGVVNTALFYRIFAGGPLMWVLIGAELLLVFIISSRVHRMSVPTATALMILYSVLNGVTLSMIFVVYRMETISTAFFVTAAMFGTMAVYGATTKRDLSKFGSILFMALIGVIIASVVNIFLNSSALGWAISLIGVVLFTALTAYDVNKIKRMAIEAQVVSDTEISRVAILGTLSLYLDFINLFLYILRLFGRNN